jgi:hypothetical protein
VCGVTLISPKNYSSTLCIVKKIRCSVKCIFCTVKHRCLIFALCNFQCTMQHRKNLTNNEVYMFLKMHLLVHDDSQIVYRANVIQHSSTQNIRKLYKIACSRECYIVLHLSTLRNNEFLSYHSDSLFKSD